MFNEKTLNRWNMTADECDKAVRKVTLKGYRLTLEEKEELFFYFMENIMTRDDVDAQIKSIEYGRKLAREFEEDKKHVREFVKEWRRLERKYDGFDYEDKTLDELVEMWLDNYFELYFMADHLDSIKYYGGKQYAQYYLHIRGGCPASEVSMWD